MKENLGKLIWIVNLNPIYLVISQLRDSIIEGNLDFYSNFWCFIYEFYWTYFFITLFK